ncbi:glutamate receptor ionotropic, kainate 2-like [Palaemon carinicauda]|uniref:glutamate receptor ionotropic, kainate 2-like n=1 Tax=Palaemon carinicauda TaxID=392227 RepID=UPI0035B6552B
MGNIVRQREPASEKIAMIRLMLLLVMTNAEVISGFKSITSDSSDLIEDASGAIEAVIAESVVKDFFLFVVTDDTNQTANVPKSDANHYDIIYSRILDECDTYVHTKYRINLIVPYSQRSLEIARWNQRDGLRYTSDYRMFPNKFDILIDGGQLRTTAEIYAPHIMLKRKRKPGDKHAHNPFYGPVVELFNILTERMNFTYTVTRPPDGAWGYKYPNGTWNGMVGMLAKGEMDLAFVPFSVLYTRAQVLDYTATLMIDYGRILARKGETEINPWGFLMPLAPNVWLYLLLSLGIVMGISFFISLFMKREGISEFSLVNFVRIFFTQDLEERSVKGLSRSILVAAWMITMVVMMESYAGNLRSLLIVRYVPQPYHKVRAVLDDPRVTVLWMSGGSYQQILFSIETGDFKELADAGLSKISYLEFTNFEERVVTEVSRGDHVMMWEGLALEIILTRHYSDTGSCLFYLSKERFFPLMSAMGTQKFSPLIPALNKRIMRVTESGLYYQWIKGEMRNFTYCANAPTTILVQSTLSLSNLWGIFVILGAGYLSSSLVFFMEMGVGSLVFNK